MPTPNPTVLEYGIDAIDTQREVMSEVQYIACLVRAADIGSPAAEELLKARGYSRTREGQFINIHHALVG